MNLGIDLSEVSPWAALSESGLERYLVNKSFPTLQPWSLSTCRDQGTKDGALKLLALGLRL